MKHSVYQVSLSRTRQYANAPMLWGTVLAGSLLLNVSSVLAFQAFLRQMQSPPSVFEPFEIELVESPISTQVARGTASQSAITEADASPNPSIEPTIESAINPTTEPTTELYSPDNEFSRIEQNPAQPDRAVADTSSSQTAVSKSDQPQSSVLSGERESVGSEFQDESQALTEDPVPASEELEGPVTSGIALPPIPNAPNPEENVVTGQMPLGDPSAISRNFIPPTVSAHVKVSSDESDRLAIPLTEAPADPPAEINENSTKTFASHELGCSLTPDSLRSFGQPVTLEISLNEQGTLDNQSATTVQSSGGNDSYNDLAICVLKHWRFNTASSPMSSTTTGKAISRRLEVDVTLTR